MTLRLATLDGKRVGPAPGPPETPRRHRPVWAISASLGAHMGMRTQWLVLMGRRAGRTEAEAEALWHAEGERLRAELEAAVAARTSSSVPTTGDAN